MGSVEVSPDDLRAFANRTGRLASEMTEASAFDLAGNMAAMTPVFGLVGADYLAAFDTVQTQHAESFASLATYFTNAAANLHANANAYEHTDASTAAKLRAVTDKSV